MTTNLFVLSEEGATSATGFEEFTVQTLFSNIGVPTERPSQIMIPDTVPRFFEDVA